MQSPPQIQHPKHILLLSSPSTDISPILTALQPQAKGKNQGEPQNETHTISTPYYTASIPIWRETIPSTQAWLQEWTSVSGAADVISAIGAWILVFDFPSTTRELDTIKELMGAVRDVVEFHAKDDLGTEGLRLAVGLKGNNGVGLEMSEEEWEGIGLEMGRWEVVDASAPGGRNEFGELRGLERLVEALLVGEWEGGGGDGDEISEGLEGLEIDGEEEDDLEGELGRVFGGMEGEMRQPMLGTKFDAEVDDGDEANVDELQTMLLKLQAARDLGADLPQFERRKLAAKAVKEVMKM